MKFSPRFIEIVIHIQMLLNLLTFILGVIVLFMAWDIESTKQFLIPVLLSLIVYLGLMYRGLWVIPIIIAETVFALVQSFFYQSTTLLEVAVKIFVFAYGAFWLFFFTKKEVREYLGANTGR